MYQGRAFGKSDMPLLLERLGGDAVFQAPGVLMERYALDESASIAGRLERLTAATTKLDAVPPCQKPITRWHLEYRNGLEKMEAGRKRQ